MTDFKSSSVDNKGITCPNHGEPLEGLPTPLPSKGEGMCPVSGCMFAYEVDLDNDEIGRDKFGNPIKGRKFNVTGDEE